MSTCCVQSARLGPCAEALHSSRVRNCATTTTYSSSQNSAKISRSIDSHRDIRTDTVSNRSIQRFVCSRLSTRPRYSLRRAATRKQTCRRRLDKNQFQRNCVKGRRLGGSRTWEEIERISNLRHAVPGRIQRRWRKDDYAERNVERED